MMTSVRKETLQVLAELSELTPDVRLGQLIANLAYSALEPTSESIWDVEDEQLLAAARKILCEAQTRGSTTV